MKKLLAGTSLVGALACGPTSCIARGSRVRTPGGDRQIEEVEEGDQILCVDPNSGQLVTATVSTTRSAHRECVRLSYAGLELLATSDHPLYCPISRQWAPAGDWALGEKTHLLRVVAEGVIPVTVEQVSTFAGVHEVFDLTVDHELHNFIANDVLVHNKQNPALCYLPDRQPTMNNETCTCQNGGQGRVQCSGGGSSATCVDCAADAGTPDAGP